MYCVRKLKQVLFTHRAAHTEQKVNKYLCFLYLQRILCLHYKTGEISMRKCWKPVRKYQHAIVCEDYWFYLNCIDLPMNYYDILSTSADRWLCKNCISKVEHTRHRLSPIIAKRHFQCAVESLGGPEEKTTAKLCYNLQ